MVPLVRLSLLLRRLARRSAGFLAAGAVFAVVLAGHASPIREPSPFLYGTLTVLALVLGRRVIAKWKAGGDAPALVDMDLGLLLGAGLYAGLARFDGSFDGPLSPAVFVLVGWLATVGRPGASMLVCAILLGFEAVARSRLLHETAPEPLVRRAAFVLAFVALSLTLLRSEVIRIRAVARTRVDAEISRLKDDARRYRLTGGAEDRPQGGDRLARSSVEEIHQSVHYALDLLRRSLGLHTAVLLWQNDAGTHFRISELSTASDDVLDTPIPVKDGILAVVLSKRESVALAELRPSYNVPYYDGPCPVRALLAIPVFEGDIVRGVLAVDRTDGVAFTASEEELVQKAALYCHRAIENERVFVQLERAKIEQGKLYRAARSLGAALSESDVLDAGVRAAREIASFDLAAVTLFDDVSMTHEVCAAQSASGEIDDLVGKTFKHNAGLVSMVVQNRFPLPYRGEFDAKNQVVLTKRYPWPSLPSLLVLPLLLHGRPLGTLILGAKRRHAFGESVRATLEVLASHLAVSLSNARMVHKLETMATTDGLTGLLNKRAMLEAADQKVLAASRFGRKLSVLITDIDFFKKVNDTHGHDIGDVVIKGLGDILRRQKRSTDLVARFGGEEFVILCEQTDEAGALLLAERIREDLEKTVFPVPGGELSVTCSLGVATFPEAGQSWETLFKAADEALYASKRGGRNQVSVHAPKPTSEIRIKEAPGSSPTLGRSARG